MSLAGIVGAAFLVTFPGAPAQESPGKEEWIQLFNGNDLDGWTPKIRGHEPGDNYAHTFRVQDGAITVGYDEYEEFGWQFGHLFYKEPFSHYRLRLEYRFVGNPAPGAPEWAFRNSGVMLHSQAPETMPREQDFPISLEFQFLGGLDDGEPRPTGNMCSPGTHVEYEGKFNDTHCIESSAPTLHGDQWVRAEVLVLGSERIVHYINGEPVIEYGNTTYGGGVVSGHRPELKPEGEPLGAGYIALQSEGHPIQFRHIELLNLAGCMDPASSRYRSYFVASDPAGCREDSE